MDKLQEHPLYLAIERFLDLRNPSSVLLSCSAGVDSLFLFYSLLVYRSRRPQFSFEVFHLYHHIHLSYGQASFYFLSKKCQQYQVPLHAYWADIPTLSRVHKQSLEMQGHQTRSQWRRSFLLHHPNSYVITGHHLDDLSETLLLRFFHGMGDALVLPSEENRLLRPLLPFSKQEILHVMKEQGLFYVEDISNVDLHIPRNQIRHRIIPEIKKYFPHLNQSLSFISQQLEQQRQTLSLDSDYFQTESFWNTSISLDLWLAQKERKIEILQRHVKQQYHTILKKGQILDLLQKIDRGIQNQILLETKSIQISLCYGKLVFLSSPKYYAYQKYLRTIFPREIASGQEWVFENWILKNPSSTPYLLRTLEPGDKWGKSTHLISSILKEKKIPLYERALCIGVCKKDTKSLLEAFFIPRKAIQGFWSSAMPFHMEYQDKFVLH